VAQASTSNGVIIHRFAQIAGTLCTRDVQWELSILLEARLLPDKMAFPGRTSYPPPLPRLYKCIPYVPTCDAFRNDRAGEFVRRLIDVTETSDVCSGLPLGFISASSARRRASRELVRELLSSESNLEFYVGEERAFSSGAPGASETGVSFRIGDGGSARVRLSLS